MTHSYDTCKQILKERNENAKKLGLHIDKFHNDYSLKLINNKSLIILTSKISPHCDDITLENFRYSGQPKNNKYDDKLVDKNIIKLLFIKSSKKIFSQYGDLNIWKSNHFIPVYKSDNNYSTKIIQKRNDKQAPIYEYKSKCIKLIPKTLTKNEKIFIEDYSLIKCCRNKIEDLITYNLFPEKRKELEGGIINSKQITNINDELLEKYINETQYLRDKLKETTKYISIMENFIDNNQLQYYKKLYNNEDVCVLITTQNSAYFDIIDDNYIKYNCNIKNKEYHKILTDPNIKKILLVQWNKSKYIKYNDEELWNSEGYIPLGYIDNSHKLKIIKKDKFIEYIFKINFDKFTYRDLKNEEINLCEDYSLVNGCNIKLNSLFRNNLFPKNKKDLETGIFICKKID